MEKLLLRIDERRSIYDSLKDRAKRINEKKKIIGPARNVSETSLPGLQEMDVGDSSSEEFNPDTSQFRPEFSEEKKEKFFAVRGKVDISMEDRRQVWLPKEFSEYLFDLRLSYFSERSAQMQNQKMKLLNHFYAPHAGKYRACGGLVLNQYYEDHSMLSLSAIAMTSDIGYIARGHGNGMVKIWNINTDSQVTMEPNEDSSRITKIKFIEQQDNVSLFAVSRAGKIYYCSQSPKGWGCEVYATEKGNEIESMDIAKRHKRIVTAGSDATIRVYNVETRKVC